LLHLAVSRNSPDIVEALLKHGVDVNMLDFMVSGQNGCEGAELLYIHITLWLLWGHTLLHLAAEKL
jgi:ankyrin repeat protein